MGGLVVEELEMAIRDVTTEGMSLEEARARRDERMPAAEVVILETVIASPKIETIEAWGATVELASEQADKLVPPGCTVLARETRGAGSQSKEERDFWDEADARAWQPRDEFTKVQSIRLKKRGKRGLLRWLFGGREPHTFDVSLIQLARVDVRFHTTEPFRLQSLVGSESDRRAFSSDWIERRLGDADAWAFALASEHRTYLAGLDPPHAEIVVTRIVQALEGVLEYWQFSNCTMLIEEGLGAKAAPALPILLQARYLKHREASWRQQTMKAIGSLGPLAAGALPLLSAATVDEDEHVRGAAQVAIKRIVAETA